MQLNHQRVSEIRRKNSTGDFVWATPEVSCLVLEFETQVFQQTNPFFHTKGKFTIKKQRRKR